MPATDALLAKVDFAEALSSSTGRTHLERMAEAFLEELSGDRLEPPSRQVDSWQAWTMASEAFYVHPMMRDVVTAAAATMPSEDLLPEDLPTPQGFVLIPGGIGMVNQFGRQLTINAVLWSAFGGGVSLLMLTDKYDTTDFYNAEAQQEGLDLVQLPRYMPTSLLRAPFHQALPTSQTFGSTLPMGIHVDQRQRGDGTYELHLLRSDGTPAHEDDIPDLDFGEHPDPVARWLLAMWRLMQQSLAVVEPEQPTRQLRRQLERRNVKDRRVSVISLRRKAPRGTGEREVSWTHRWIRRGHWRQQPCKVDGEWTTRAIWIHPTICGPDDKPLLVREHVYSLRR